MSKVQIYCYDLTKGLAAALSPMLLGTQIEGVWHTGVVIDGREEVFFGYGIHRARAGSTMFGTPHHIIDLGTTEVPADMRAELLTDLAPRYRPEDYNLLFHNCNHFSNEFGQLLTGEGLPDYILNQAEVVFNTPWGQQLMPMVLAMEGFTGRATANGLAQQAPAAPAAAAGGPAVAGTSAATEATTSAAASAAANAGMAAAARAARSTAVAGGSTVHAAQCSSDGSASESRQQQQILGSASSPPAADVPPGAVSAVDAAFNNNSSSAAGSGQPATEAAEGTATEKVTAGVAALDLTADSRVDGAAH